MKKYLAIITIVWKQNIRYKYNLCISFLIGNISILGVYHLWKAIYVHHSIATTCLEGIVTYVVIAMLLKQFVESFGLEWHISEDIAEGKLTNLLQYPIPYHHYLILLLMGEKSLHLMLRLPILLFIIFIIRHELTFPTLPSFLLFLTSSIMAFFISSFITLCIGFLSFWFIEVNGLFYLNNLISNFLSGVLIPLQLFPKYFTCNLAWLPYYYTIFFPIGIFRQTLPDVKILHGLIAQIFWICILYYLCSLIYRKGLNQYEHFGG